MLKQYDAALLAYERALYQAESLEEHFQLLTSKSELYLQLGSYENAFKTCQRGYFDQLSDTAKLKLKSNSALAAYLNSEFNKAEFELLNLKLALTDTSLMEETYFLQVLIHNEKQEWNKAKELLLKSVDLTEMKAEHRDSLKSVVELMYQEENIPKLKDPQKAGTLSAFLPGVGHLYAGYFWEGFANVALQLVGLGVGGVAIYFKYYITGVAVGYGMFQRFYSGGVRRAEYLANKKNYLRTRSFNDRVKLNYSFLNRLK